MQNQEVVRVRFAPSPTGYLHVGGVRACLFNWLYAKNQKGKLILRIEDTDQERSTAASEKMVLETLNVLGLHADEGPEQSGSHAPYRQSDRFPLYRKYAKQLLEDGKAYYCFCSPETIAQKRETALKLGKTPLYDGTCRKVTHAQALERISKGERAGVRLKAPHKDYILKDLVRGDIEFRAGTVGDFLIMRSPRSENEMKDADQIGMPVYNFSCVVDDALMEISHVIRGEDHISNTSRQMIIYEALGFSLPQFAHTAMVLGADRQKLSKRNGDVSAQDYLEKGYLKEALLNFLALLGWWPKGDFKPVSGHPEILSIDEMISQFSIESMQKSPAVFDTQKLLWMNGFYIRMLPISEIVERARPFIEKDENLKSTFSKKDQAWVEKAIELVRTEVSLLSELPQALHIFVGEQTKANEEAKVILGDAGKKVLIQDFLNTLEAYSGEWKGEVFSNTAKDLGKKHSLKGKDLFMPLRAALTGRVHGPDIKGVFELLGKELSTQRIKSSLL